MGWEMADLWIDCFNPAMNMSPKDFGNTFCRVCKNVACERSAGSKAKWVARVTTQVDRLLTHPNFADPMDPRYQSIRAVDFPSAVRDAMRLEISDRKGDWSIPNEKDAQSLAIQMTAQPTAVNPIPKPKDENEVVGNVLRSEDIRGTNGEIYCVRLVETAIGKPEWTCTCKSFQFGRARPCKHIEYVLGSSEPIPSELVPKQFQKEDPVTYTPTIAQPFYPTQPNIPMPPGGVMVDGSMPPPPQLRGHKPIQNVTDPWAVPPTKKEVIVPVGGRVVFGGQGVKK